VSGRPDPTSLVGRSVTIEAPATIANLGAGYDTLGLAVDLVLRVTIEARLSVAGLPDVVLDVAGEGESELPADRSNRLVVGLQHALGLIGFDQGRERLAWRISMRNEIPLERGLGSSAAATVAGVVAAFALAGRPVEQPSALQLAAQIEGHPDNVAPAFLGGLTASIKLEDGGPPVQAIRLDPPSDVAIVAWIPDRRLPTSEMRRVLPDTVPRADAIANLARVAVGVAGLASGRSDVLSVLTQDRLHEPYRTAAYPELPGLIAAARGAGAIGACLAGAGSTVVAFVPAPDDAARDAVEAALAAEAAARTLPGRLQRIGMRREGARITSH
jgi:homoserine kinase